MSARGTRSAKSPKIKLRLSRSAKPAPTWRSSPSTRTAGESSAPGQEGLLYARGSNVMQGYYGRPSESAACFISNPFASGREEKLYCTGDWVTLDEKGDFLLIGRKDHMIKTRGYRVELGEIEAVMVAHPAVNEAVALAIPDEAIGNTIRAIVTINDSNSVNVDGVEATLCREVAALHDTRRD